MNGSEIGHRPLHGARALDDLRQEHLAGAEQLADDLHAVHQRPLDDVERPRILAPRLLDVLLDEIDDAVDERVRQPRLDRAAIATRVQFAFLLRALAPSLANSTRRSVASGRRLKMTSSTRSSRSFGMSSHDHQLAGVDDAHVHAGLDGVIQKRRVNRLRGRRRCRGTRTTGC